jgi:hypothetical protein
LLQGGRTLTRLQRAEQAQQKAVERLAKQKAKLERCYVIGELAYAAGLGAWEDVDLAVLFEVISRLPVGAASARVLAELLAEHDRAF